MLQKNICVYRSFLFLGLLFLCIFLYRTEFGRITFDEAYIATLSAQATTDASNFRFQTAIREFKELSILYRLKGDANLAAQMMTKMGFLYDKDGSYLAGIPIIKKVAYDESLSPSIRSEAIARLIMAYSGNEKIEIMQAIFNDKHPMMTDALGGGALNNVEDLRKAAVSLLEHARSVYEYSYLDYLLAARKSYLLLDDFRNLNSGEVATKKAEIIALIKSGDDLFNKEVTDSDFRRGGFNYDFMSSGQSQKLQAFAELARIDPIYEKSATDVYNGQQTMRTAYYPPGYDSPTYFGTDFFIRFYYASLLAHFYGSAKKNEIEAILAPTMIEAGNRGIANRKIAWRFYENAVTRTENGQGSNYIGIIEIASISPAFNRFVRANGWLTGEPI